MMERTTGVGPTSGSPRCARTGSPRSSDSCTTAAARRHTSLLDDTFAGGLAEFARACARRYPWIEMVTPVNEPLTTARFSGLYGHWYPHASDSRAFARMLLNECLATRAAMRAIRAEIPGARLVQTEDLGYTHATEPLGYQAEFENERRWLSFDMSVRPRHAVAPAVSRPARVGIVTGGARRARRRSVPARSDRRQPLCDERALSRSSNRDVSARAARWKRRTCICRRRGCARCVRNGAADSSRCSVRRGSAIAFRSR